MTAQVLSYIFTALGLVGFYLAGKKVWWCWYVNILNQFLWTAFALITGYYALLLGTLFYFMVFTKNAYLWTKEHYAGKFNDRLLPEVTFKFDDSHFRAGMKKTLDGAQDLLPQVALAPLSFDKIEARKGENLKIDGNEVFVSATPGEVSHICHVGPPLWHSHTLVCPTGEHPTGWQHVGGPHKMCAICR